MNINIGDVFYCIEIAGSKTYHSTCRLCEGKKELTVKGFTFRCPACTTEEKVLTVNCFKVVRYRVYSIKTVMPDDDWKPCDTRRIYYGLYHKHGKGYYMNTHSRTEKSEHFFEDYLNNEDITKHTYDNTIFSDYALAVKCAEKLNQESIEEVRKYNAEHGSNFELPEFDIEHDKKSK